MWSASEPPEAKVRASISDVQQKYKTTLIDASSYGYQEQLKQLFTPESIHTRSPTKPSDHRIKRVLLNNAILDH